MRPSAAIATALFLVACGAPEASGTPPQPMPPPEVATDGAIGLRLARDLPTDLAATRALLLSDPLIYQLRGTERLAAPVAGGGSCRANGPRLPPSAA